MTTKGRLFLTTSLNLSMMLVSFIPSSKVLVTELLCNGCKVTTFFGYCNKNQQKKPKAQNFRLTNTKIIHPPSISLSPLAFRRGAGGEAGEL
jgi:hypothetical protein